MKKYLNLLIVLLVLQSCVITKQTYLKRNSYDLNSTRFKLPQNNFKIVGFGAYHGSQKTENVELALIHSLTKNKSIKYYLPETDFSIAYYFNTYLQTGDTILLKDLVIMYGNRVPQERTIEVYNKWKNLKLLNDNLPDENKLKVVGIDLQVNYKYVSKHIIELIDKSVKTKAIQNIRNMVKLDTTTFSLGDLSYAYKVLTNFVSDYETNPNLYQSHISNTAELSHIIKNLKLSFNVSDAFRNRDQIMFDNYVALDSIYNFKANAQFLRMGFSHIEKSREGKTGYPYFFTQLIENNFYTKEEVISIIGYFTNSKVVWDEIYDEEGNYKDFTVEAGYGIGDYDKEYFLGIDNLKAQKVSDLTLYKLNKKQSPYHQKSPDLIEVVMTDQKSNGENVKETATTDYLDYAVLISNSKASTPIFEMDKKSK